MKRIAAIAAAFLTIATSSAVINDDNENIVDRLTMAETIDPTTAFLMLDTSNSDYDLMVDDILGFASNYLGRPYRHGAKGPSAFDCSGFTSFVFGNFGISLSPSSSTQYTQGESVAREDVRPGDLLFFGGHAGGRRVGHVALVTDVDADGTLTFIHAASSGGIRYDKFPDGGYYSKRYIGARRVLK